MPRPRSWVDTIPSTVQDGTNQVFDLLVGLPNSNTRTSVRALGDLTFVRTTLTQVDEEIQQISCGICVVDLAAFVAGQASLPDPRVADDAPPRGWIWRWTGTQVYVKLMGEAIWAINPRVMFDVGGARKVDRGKLVLITSKTALSGGEQNLRISGLVRILILD